MIEKRHPQQHTIQPEGKEIQTGDKGIVIGGSVTDSTIIHAETIILAERLWRDLKPVLPPATLHKATAAYLSYLTDRHDYLSFKGMRASDRMPLKLKLLELYVPLKARMELPEGDTWNRDISLAGRDVTHDEQKTLRFGEPVTLLDVLKKHSGVIVLGDPGAGKTTFVKYLALCLARGEGKKVGLADYLPILLPLAAFANALETRDIPLDDFIIEYFKEIGANLPVGEMLHEALKAGRTLILLDGLDEVRDLNVRNTVVERVMDFYAFHRRQGNKFVLTSRIVAYRAVRPAAEDLAECTIIDFEDGEIEEFIGHWITVLERQRQGDTAIARRNADTDRRELMETIHRNPGIRQLASTPLLLTILVLMKRQDVSLPERRVQLYDQYVNTLLSTWNRARSISGRTPGRDMDEIQTVRILAPLALWMHEVSPGVGLVGREAMHRKLEELFAESGNRSSQQAAQQFLQDVGEHAALLLERGSGAYGFIHLTFEEYLAAVALALMGQGNSKPIIKALSQHVGEQAWREVTLLTIGYLGICQQLPRVAGEVIEAMVTARPGPPGEAVILVGDAVLDTWPDGVPSTSKQRVIQALLETMQDGTIRPELRRHAGLLLGRLGWRPRDLDRFVGVAAGEYLAGVRKEAKEIPYSYFIANYPVTNIQYARFVKENGYREREYWSDAGWEWRTGKYDSRSMPDVERDWLEHRPLAKRGSPYYWHNVELGNPIVPVVGVCYFEAEAYCNWLARKMLAVPEGYIIRLPRDGEWERAARGLDGREYPWGNGFNKDAANTWESESTGSGLGGTTAVCTFPQGISPAGVWDMSGNVWEWTRTWYDGERKYRIVRGGSWIGYQWFAHTSFCNWYIPWMFSDNLGFRIVIAPKDTEEKP